MGGLVGVDMYVCTFVGWVYIFHVITANQVISEPTIDRFVVVFCWRLRVAHAQIGLTDYCVKT